MTSIPHLSSDLLTDWMKSKYSGSNFDFVAENVTACETIR